MTTLQVDLLPADSFGISCKSPVPRRIHPGVSTNARREQLVELAASADRDAAECAAADLFREFGVSC